MRLISLICLISLIYIKAGQNKDNLFYPSLSGELSAKGENFKAKLMEANGLPKQEFTSGKSKLTATLINTALKIDKSNSSYLSNLTKKFIPTAKAGYPLTDNVELEYQVIKDPGDGKIPGAGFVVGTTVPAITDITFDYWIINEVAQGGP